MITGTFDLTAGWTFHGDPAVDFGIRFTDGDSDRVYPDGLAFGWTLLVNGDETETHEWPPSNIVIRELSPSRVFPYRADVKPDDVVTLSVWATNAGETVKSETTFTVPRPLQPFPSWTWDGESWKAPVPYPEGDGWYEWDENTQTWIAATEND